MEFKTEEKHGTVSLGDTDSYEYAITIERIPTCESIVDVLMKRKNTFPPFKPKTTKGPAKQYNAIVEFIGEKKFGIQGGHFAEYSELVTQFASVLWEN